MKLRVAEIRKAKKLRQVDMAERLGMHWTKYSDLERGRSNMTVRRLQEIAQILDVSPGALIAKMPDRTVEVRGHVEAGHWAEAFEWPEEDRYTVAISTPDHLRNVPFFAVETRGLSMNLLYPEGTVLICSDYAAFPEPLEPGRRYVVERIRPGGEHETTVKTLRRDADGKLWLSPESSDPRYVAIPIEGAEGETIEIKGRVYYSQRPE